MGVGLDVPRLPSAAHEDEHLLGSGARLGGVLALLEDAEPLGHDQRDQGQEDRVDSRGALIRVRVRVRVLGLGLGLG